MRTTMTLDADVVRLIQDAVHRERRPTKQVVNDALRRGLRRDATPVPPRPFRQRTHAAGLVPGVDPVGLHRLVDELEIDDALSKRR